MAEAALMHHNELTDAQVDFYDFFQLGTPE